MEKFLKIAGLIILQLLIGIAIFLVALYVATGAEMHYSGNPNYEECIKTADTPAELEKEGDYNEQ